jgi:hypothetical protein
MLKNKLLLRQIKKSNIDLSENPTKESLHKLLELVEITYEDNKKSRRIIEHSFDVLSQERNRLRFIYE